MNDPEAQSERWFRVLAARPENARAINEVVRIYADAGASEALLSRLHAHAERSPEDTLIFAQVLLANKTPDVALEALKKFPDDPRVITLRARALLESGEFSSAAETFQSVSERSEGAAKASLLLDASRAWQLAGHHENSLARLSAAAEADPANPEIRRAIVQQAIASGSTAVAAKHLEWMINHGTPSDQLDATIQLSRIFETTEDIEQAIAFTEAAIQRTASGHFRRKELEHRLVDLHIRAGTLEALARKTEAAAQAGKDALAAWRFLAQIRQAQGDHEKQRIALQAAHALTPADALLARELAELESSMGHHDQAIAIITPFHGTRPDDVEWILFLAQIHVRRGAMEEAHALVQSLITKHHNTANLRSRIIKFYESNRMQSQLRTFILESNQNASEDVAFSSNIRRWENDPQLLKTLAESAAKKAADTETVKASDLAALSEALSRTGDQERAQELVQRALTLSPADPESLKVLLTLNAAKQDYTNAQHAVDQAVEINPDLASTIDYQLFQLLSAAPGQTEEPEDAAASLVTGLMNAMKPGSSQNVLVKKREQTLQQRWQDSGIAQDAIRLAHWQSWRGEQELATATLRLALNKEPDNIRLLEMQLDLAKKQGDKQQALSAIQKLSVIQPSRRTDLESERAGILLDREDFDEALDVYAKLTQSNPSNPELWMDLASAQQRTGNYYNALETWMKAFAAATPSERQRIRTPILAVIERLTLWDRGVDFLLEYASSQLDEKSSMAAYDEAIAFALTHGKIQYLSARLDRMANEGNSSASLAVAQAGVAQAIGDNLSALQLLATATTHAVDRVAIWNRLLESAISSDNADQALLAATSLVRESDTADAWIRLADTQELMKSRDDANATWQIIRHRYNRDPAALDAAARFFERSGNKNAATTCKIQAAEIEGATSATVFAGIKITMETGNREKALELCDKILATTNPLFGSEMILPGASEIEPGSERRSFTIAMRALGGLTDPDSIAALRKTGNPAQDNSEATIRLESIRLRAQMSQAGEEKAVWTTWCQQAASPMEAVWGWYAMGETGKAMDLLSAEMSVSPSSDQEQAFAWIGLKGNHMETLRAWINASPDDRRRRSEFVFLALSRLLLHNAPSADRLSVLFPADPESIGELWQAAWMLAAHGHFHEAIAISRPALAITSSRHMASSAQTLAAWYLILRDPVSALEVLKNLPAERNTMSLDQPAVHAWRMRWLLESETGRRAMEAEIPTIKDPIFSATLSALAAALNHNPERIQKSTEKLVTLWMQMIPLPPLGESLDVSVRSSVAIAQTWQLPVLAFEIARAASQLDPAHVVLRDDADVSWHHDLEIMTLLAQLQCVPPRQLDYYLAKNTPLALDSATLTSLTRQLEVSGHQAAAAKVQALLVNNYPEDMSSLNEIISSARRKGDIHEEIQIQERLIAALPEPIHFQTLTDSSLRLAELYIQDLRPADALTVIEHARRMAPSNPRLVAAADLALFELGKTDTRIRLWEEQSKYFPEAGAMWIRALSDAGREDEIPKIIRRWTDEAKSIPIDALSSLVNAYAAQSPLLAMQYLQALIRQGAWESVASAATALRNTECEDAAVALLRDSMMKLPASHDRLTCATGLISLTQGKMDEQLATAIQLAVENVPTSNHSTAQAIAEIDRAMVAANPHLKHWLTNHLNTRMERDGDAVTSKHLLTEMALDAGDINTATKLATSISEISTWQELDLVTLANRLSQAGVHRAAAHIYDLLYLSQPTQQNFAFQAATERWFAGERHRSRKLIEPFWKMRWFDPVLHNYLARYHQKTGDNTTAAELYAEIIAQDPAVSKPDSWAALGEIYAESGDLDKAKLFLTTAYTNPDFKNIDPFIKYIFHLPSERITPDFLLPIFTPKQSTQARIAVIQHFIASKSPELAQPWLSTDLASNREALSTLNELAAFPGCHPMLDQYWKEARELPASRALATAHSDYLLARAHQAETAGKLKEALSYHESATEVAPWRFECAASYAEKLLKENLPEQATSVMKVMLQSSPSQEDKVKAYAMLKRIKMSDGLIPPSDGI